MDASELLKRVRRVEITTRKLSDRIFSGEYSSAFKGRGMAFSENREYQPGDEVRTIDWNVTARTGTPHVKVFEEERELTVFLLIDVSASTANGTRERTLKDLATELSAVLAFSAMGNNDKVGAIFFTDRVEKFIAPGKGRSHVLRIVRDLLDFKPEGVQSDVVQALAHFSAAMRKRTVAFLISDFKHAGGNVGLETMLKRVGRRHDMVALHLDDPLNGVLPAMGWMRIEDPETGGKRWCNTSSKRTRRNWLRARETHLNELTTLMARSGMDFATLSTEGSIVKPLLNVFHARG